ncbi:MAG: hypothetical protein NZ521_02415 [Flammeovirgaceae bacterium]|nr:hypothetical protein [Flammeovirgaceae bacterium]MDW8287548.1 hypothetical protein [Flammeovirgaceae bacterium]
MKLLQTILAFHVIFMSLGIKLEKHFCGQQLRSVQFVELSTSCCTSDSNSLPTCCHDDTSRITLEDGILFQKGLFFSQKPIFCDEKQTNVVEAVEVVPRASPKIGQKLFLEYCCFLM